jgi:hypothetical protein
VFLGHVALGLAGKRAAPEVSLATWLASVQLPDLLWPIFLLAGLEHVLRRIFRPSAARRANAGVVGTCYMASRTMGVVRRQRKDRQSIERFQPRLNRRHSQSRGILALRKHRRKEKGFIHVF